MSEIKSELITVTRAAELLGCKRTKIYNLHKLGMLVMRKIGYRSSRVTRESVDRLLADPSLMSSRPSPPSASAPAKVHRLRTIEAADYIGITPDMLYRLRASGEGPPFIKIGQVVLYETDELDAWIAARKHRSIAEQQLKDAG